MADNFINKINVNNVDYFLSPTFTSQTKNYVLAAPSNENGVPSFRQLVETDIPDLKTTYWARPESITPNNVIISNGTDGTTTLRPILNNTSTSSPIWNSSGATNDDNKRLITANTLAFWNGSYMGTSSHITYVGTITKGTWNGSRIGSNYIQTSVELQGTPTIQNTPSDGDNSHKIADTAFVHNTLKYVNAMQFKGTIGSNDSGSTITALPDIHEAGDTYRVITDDDYPIVDENGRYCESGTLIICINDGQSSNPADWTSVETNEDGAVVGPTESTPNGIARFSGNTGRIIQNSNVTINNSGSVNIPGYLALENQLKFSSSAIKHIEFSRTVDDNDTGGPSYICYPQTGQLAIGYNTGYASSIAVFDKDKSLRPGYDNKFTLGDLTHKWSTVYATTFNGALSGNATSATYLLTPTTSVNDVSGVTIGNDNRALYGLKQVFSNTTKGLITAHALSKGSKAYAIGYFLGGDAYNTLETAYGGWYVINYENPYYVSINNGAWKQDKILTSSNYSNYALPLTGGNLSGHLYLDGTTTYSTSNTAQIIFRNSNETEVTAISSFLNGENKGICINPSSTSSSNQITLYLNKPSKFPKGIEANVTGDLYGSIKGINDSNITDISFTSDDTTLSIPTDGKITYYYNLSHSTTNLFPKDTTSSGGLSLLAFGRTPNANDNRNISCFGFSNNEHLYYGYTEGSTTIPTWKQIALLDTNGTLAVEYGGTGATTATNASLNLGYFKQDQIGITSLSAGDDLNSNNLKNFGTYNSSQGSISQGITNSPITSSGFKLYVGTTYSTLRPFQLAWGATTTPWIRIYNSSTNSQAWQPWGKLVYAEINQTTNEDVLQDVPNKCSVGNDTQAVYVNTNGKVVAAKKMLPLEGGTMTGEIISTYASNTWKNSLTSSAIVINKGGNNDNFHGWICGPTKNGRIAIATYNNSDDKLYIGYGENDRIDNSFARRMTWDGSTGELNSLSVKATTLLAAHITIGGSEATLSKTISCDSTLYLSSNTATSIIFCQGIVDSNNTNEVARFNASGNFIPKSNSNYSIGTSDKKWANIYAITFNGHLIGDVTGNVTGNVTGTASNITGTVAINHGGTGTTTTPTQGGIIYASSASAYASTTAGNANQVLVSNGTSAPTWRNDRGIEYIRGTWTAASGTWTGTTQDAALYEGKQIILFMPFDGSGNATLNLTLNGAEVGASGSTTTGAKNVYYESTARFKTQKSQYSQIHLIYHENLNIDGTNYTGWWYLANIDTNDGQYYLQQHNIQAQSAITAKHIIGGTDSGYNNVDSTPFDIRYAVLYCDANLGAGENGNSNYLFHYSVNIQNSANSNISLTAYKNVYIKGTISGNIFTPISGGNPYVQNITAADDGYCYYYIGHAYNTSSITFDVTAKAIYWYKNGGIQPYTPYAASTASVALSDVTGADDVQAIEALTGTAGFLKKTAANTWTLDTSTYLTSHYTSHLYVNTTSGGATSDAATNNTATYIHLYDDSTKRDTIQIKGSGATTISATSNKVITINSTDTNNAVAHTKNVNTKYYVTGTTSDSNTTGGDTFDTGVYVTATSGELSAKRHSYNVDSTEKAYSYYNSNTNSIDFVFM